MRYISTRGAAPPVSFLDAILEGLAPDGGLYAPEAWPEVSLAGGAGGYGEDAARVTQAFAGADLGAGEAAALAARAYASPPWPAAVAPLVEIAPDTAVLELFHGPSLSFKDIALQWIGPLYDLALERRGARLSVVCATSGDTGGAAVEALKGGLRTDLFVLTPRGRVSQVQRRFMTASGAANVHVIEIDGDFDACQAIVKALFADQAFAARASLSGVNSINWARIAAQSVYFHRVAHAASAGGPVNLVIPTGNFGDAFSAYAAKRTGAPIARIVIATNANDILARALAAGRYQRGPASHATLSPAMDIQVASNFERILFEATGRDGPLVSKLYAAFAAEGGFDIPPGALARLRADFAAAAVDDAETQRAMRAAAAEGYLACPHTAVGLAARARLAGALTGPVITLATAHPAKFPETVEAATGTTPGLPPACADLFARPERLTALPGEVAAVQAFIAEKSRAWR